MKCTRFFLCNGACKTPLLPILTGLSIVVADFAYVCKTTVVVFRRDSSFFLVQFRQALGEHGNR